MVVKWLEVERSSKTLPMGSGEMVRMGECEKEINTWQSLATGDNMNKRERAREGIFKC